MIYLVSYQTHDRIPGQVEIEAACAAQAIQGAILAKHRQLNDGEEFGGILWDTFTVVEKRVK